MPCNRISCTSLSGPMIQKVSLRLEADFVDGLRIALEQVPRLNIALV